MLKAKETIIPIYDIMLTIIESDSNEELDVFLRKYLEPKFKLHDSLARTVWAVRKTKEVEHNCIYLIFDEGSKYGKIDEGIISHESLHACDYICQIIGDEYKPIEAMAYLLQYIVNEITKFLKSGT